MYELIKTSAANLFLRGISTFSKFLLLVFITRYLTVAELGIFGLFQSSIIIATYFLGFEYYFYTSRRILSSDPVETGKIIKNQFVFYIFSYIVVLPPLIIIFMNDILPTRYIVFFYLILVLDHISIEFYRIFITVSKSVFANIIFFIKSGLWVYLLILFWTLDMRKTMNLDFIWYSWLAGDLLACLTGVIYLKILKLGVLTRHKIDWVAIRQGTLISIPFFISTISLRLVDFSGRYFLDQLYSKSLVGIYSFFWSISNLIYIFVTTAVIAILYPQLVRSFKENNMVEFNQNYMRFRNYILISTVLFSMILIVLINPLLNILGKSEFYDHIDSFYILVLANFFVVVSFIPHYQLYAKDLDRYILASSILGLVICIAFNIALIPKLDVFGASLAFLISSSGIFLAKYLFNRRSISEP